LLLVASLDKSGDVLMCSTSGGVIVSINNREFVEPGSPRSAAKWRAAAGGLSRKGFGVSLGDEGNVFNVTDEGYRLADRLKNGVVA
jgi:hypothetical protein